MFLVEKRVGKSRNEEVGSVCVVKEACARDVLFRHKRKPFSCIVLVGSPNMSV